MSKWIPSKLGYVSVECLRVDEPTCVPFYWDGRWWFDDYDHAERFKAIIGAPLPVVYFKPDTTERPLCPCTETT